jgi:hypothetical protein
MASGTKRKSERRTCSEFVVWMRSFKRRQGVLGLAIGTLHNKPNYTALQLLVKHAIVCFDSAETEQHTCSEFVVWMRSFSRRQGVLGLPSGSTSRCRSTKGLALARLSAAMTERRLLLLLQEVKLCMMLPLLLLVESKTPGDGHAAIDPPAAATTEQRWLRLLLLLRTISNVHVDCGTRAPCTSTASCS